MQGVNKLSASNTICTLTTTNVLRFRLLYQGVCCASNLGAGKVCLTRQSLLKSGQRRPQWQQTTVLMKPGDDVRRQTSLAPIITLHQRRGSVPALLA